MAPQSEALTEAKLARAEVKALADITTMQDLVLTRAMVDMKDSFDKFIKSHDDEIQRNHDFLWKVAFSVMGLQMVCILSMIGVIFTLVTR